MNLSDQFKAYLLGNKKQVSKVTLKNYLSDTRKFIKWCENKFGRSFNPNDITQELAQSYIDEINTATHSSRSAKRYQSSIKKFFGFLLEYRLVRFNPFSLYDVKAIHQDDWHLKEFGNYLFNSKTSNHTIKNYISDVRQFLNWAQEVTQSTLSYSLDEINVFSKIDNFLISEYKNRLLEEAKFSPMSVNRKLSSLRKYLSFLKEKNLIGPELNLNFTKLRLKDLRSADSSANQQVEAHNQALLSLASESSKDETEENIETEYSDFAPLRLMQKIKHGITLTSDLLIIASIIKLIETFKYKLWILTGKEVFASLPEVIKKANSYASVPTASLTDTSGALDKFIIQGKINKISETQQIKSIPKSVYAPLEISTKSLPFSKRILYILRYSRPEWYKKYHNIAFVHYLHFGILVLFASFIGLKIYQSISTPRSPKTVLASHVSPKRQIAFHGTLYDQSGLPITQESKVKFAIYKSPIDSGPAQLWQEYQVVTPDQSGKFSTILGKKTTLSQDIFNDNPNLYLGITIGSAAELSPRQQLASTGLTKDAEALQGLRPITGNNSDSANTILALDSSGNLTIGGNSSPIFQAIGGEFRLSGQSLVLASNVGSNGNIIVSPDGTGIIDVQRPLQNTSNRNTGSDSGAVEVDDNFAIISSGSAQTALIINQNGTGDIISALADGTAKFSLDKAGSGSFAGNLSVLGNNLDTVSGTFNLANTNTINLNIGGAATSISIGASTGTTTIKNNLKVSGTLTIPSLSLGSIPFIDNENKIAQDNANFFWDQVNKRLGLGTQAPNFRLDVQDLQDSKATAQIYNASTGVNSIGMQVKLGITTAPQSTNRWLNFLDGNGTILGKIRGNNSSNTVTYDSNGGDFAEYFKKTNPKEIFTKGDLVCYSGLDGVEKCKTGSNGILGIFSDDAGFVGSGGHEGDDNYVLVGLIGQLQAKISPTTDPIKPGDPITFTDQEGVGTKATKPGQIVGRALEDYEPNSNKSEIKIALNVSWYDPRSVMMENGSLTAAFETKGNEATLNGPQNAEQISISIQNFLNTLENGVLNVRSISVNSLAIATDDIKIGTQTLKEYISTIVEEIVDRKIAENNKKQISIISPVSENTLITPSVPTPTASPEVGLTPSPTPELSPTPIINNIINVYNIASISASPSPTATPDPKASSSADVENIASPSATPEPSTEPTATPTPVQTEPQENSKKDNLLNLKYSFLKLKPADIATYSAELSYVPNLKSDFATFSEGLIALGPTSLTETSINGSLSLGENMKIADNSINTFGADLNLQPLRQGNLSIMGGLVSVDAQGNLSVLGNATFAKDVTVKGKFSAGIISPLANSDLEIKLGDNSGVNESKLKITDASGSAKFSINQLGDVIASGAAQFGNLKIIRGAQADTSLTSTTASGSAGTATIKANQTERTIITPYVTENSLIYISPTSSTYGSTPYIARQTDENPNNGSKGSFTVQIQSAISTDIKLNWWIVN